MSWTDKKVQKLRELWTKGHTASEIAGLFGDTTRNAVIGKAHRLNLEERAPSKSKSSSEKKSETKSVEKVSLNLFYLIKILSLKILHR
jgi:GcrA cell cycle regulator